MIDKIVSSVEAALADVRDGSTILVGGFGGAGVPEELIDALIAHGARDLTIVNNNAGNGEVGVAALLKAGRVRKIVCSYPRTADSYVFDALYRECVVTPGIFVTRVVKVPRKKQAAQARERAA